MHYSTCWFKGEREKKTHLIDWRIKSFFFLSAISSCVQRFSIKSFCNYLATQTPFFLVLNSPKEIFNSFFEWSMGVYFFVFFITFGGFLFCIHKTTVTYTPANTKWFKWKFNTQCTKEKFQMISQINSSTKV